jgi:hypothetical protein
METLFFFKHFSDDNIKTVMFRSELLGFWTMYTVSETGSPSVLR